MKLEHFRSIQKRIAVMSIKKKIILLVLCILVVGVVIFVSFTQLKSSGSENGYEDVSASYVKMEQTITAAGEVEPSDTKTISFSTSKKFSGMCVEEDEPVVKGQHLILYSNGTYEDAPANGIIMEINAPETGTYAESGNNLTFGYTDELSLKITVTEDEINHVSRGDEATIIVNADTSKEFSGTITSKKAMSTTLISEKASSTSSDSSDSDSSDSDSSAGGSSSSADTQSKGSIGGSGNSQGSSAFGSSSSIAYYTVNMEFINDGSLKTGMSAISTITISSRNNVLGVPVEAVLYNEDGQAYVNVVDGDEINETAVTTGESNPDYVEITKGLKEGDVVRVEKQSKEDD